jgi:hypothetical protein
MLAMKKGWNLKQAYDYAHATRNIGHLVTNDGFRAVLLRFEREVNQIESNTMLTWAGAIGSDGKRVTRRSRSIRHPAAAAAASKKNGSAQKTRGAASKRNGRNGRWHHSCRMYHTCRA